MFQDNFEILKHSYPSLPMRQVSKTNLDISFLKTLLQTQLKTWNILTLLLNTEAPL